MQDSYHKGIHRQSEITLCRWKTNPDPLAERNTKQTTNFSLREEFTQPGGKSIAKPGVVDTRVPALPEGWPSRFRRTIPQD